jgi:plastocyanin domain-containing protein
MNYFSRLIKPLLALTLSAAVLSTTGCSKEAQSADAKKSAPEAAKAPEKAREAAPGEPRVIQLTITEKGYEPSPVTLKQGEPVKLVLTRTTDHTCATEIVLDEYGINTKLPLNEPVTVSFTPDKAGKLVYGCAMSKMISGVLMVE